jgi:hypothetical protein
MKISILNMLSILVLATLCACSAPKSSDYRMTGFINDTKESSMIAFDDGQNSKTGKACTKNYLGLYTTGDSSIGTASKNGGITKVNYVDKSIFSIAALYSEVCTIVKGH